MDGGFNFYKSYPKWVKMSRYDFADIWNELKLCKKFIFIDDFGK